MVQKTMAVVRAQSGALRLEWDTITQTLKVNGTTVKPSFVRSIKELVPVLQDKDWHSNQDPKKPAYFVFRKIAAYPSDTAKLKKSGISVDVTVFPEGSFGKELAKTHGHYHKKPAAEWYEVLSGQAVFLLQHKNPETGKIDDVLLADATPGTGVMIRPGYGHVSINASQKKPLVLLNVWKPVPADYEPFKKSGGGAVHLFLGGFVSKNAKYGQLPAHRRVRATKAEKPLYDRAVSEPKSLGF